jgi:hypothetical protein
MPAFLAAHVQDMQLVLFDLPGGPSNLPDAAAVAHLADIGARRDLTYTVHLIDDLATPASQRHRPARDRPDARVGAVGVGGAS